MGKLKEVHIRWIGIFLVAILATLNDGDDHMADEPLWFHYFVSLCFTAVYWNGAWAIIHFFRRRFPEISKTKRRLSLTGLVVIIWMSIGGIPLKLIFDVSFVVDTSFSIGCGCSFKLELVCHSLLRLLDVEDLLVFGVFLFEDINTFSLNAS